jgi:hypothetical protein
MWLATPAAGGAGAREDVQPVYEFTSSGLTHSWDGAVITPLVRAALLRGAAK